MPLIFLIVLIVIGVNIYDDYQESQASLKEMCSEPYPSAPMMMALYDNTCND